MSDRSVLLCRVCGASLATDGCCPECGKCDWCCQCGEAGEAFDADELGLDPEEEWDFNA